MCGKKWRSKVGKDLYLSLLLWQQLKLVRMHCIHDSSQPMKFLGISFNISELIGKMIFSRFSFLQLWRHVTFICISRSRPPYHKFLNFECNYLENGRRAFFPILQDLSSQISMSFGWIFPLGQRNKKHLQRRVQGFPAYAFSLSCRTTYNELIRRQFWAIS